MWRVIRVTPHVGVWIETFYYLTHYNLDVVTPHVGVWIETMMMSTYIIQHSVTPHVGVWIETFSGTRRGMCTESLPTWECGLKRFSLL